MLSLILLKVSATQNLIGIFFPTILMLASIPFWFIKKIPNLVFTIYSFCALFGLIFLIFIASVNSNDIQSPGLAGAIVIAIILMVCNGFQFFAYERFLNTKRCPQCHSIGMKTLKKDIDTEIKRHYTTYKAKGGRYDGKRYDKIGEAIRQRIKYKLYCPSCGNICNWEEEKEDYLVHDERPKDLR